MYFTMLSRTNFSGPKSLEKQTSFQTFLKHTTLQKLKKKNFPGIVLFVVDHWFLRSKAHEI